MATLPEVGARAVLLGMAAFSANAKTVQGQLNAIAQSSYYLERTTSRAFAEIASSSTKGFGAIKTAATIVTGALAAVATATVVMGSKYNKELAYMGALSEGTSGQIAKLNDKQLELSRRSTQSALQINAMSTELVKSGVGIEQVSESALEAVNNMVVASNGELDAAKAASLVQVAVAGFAKNYKGSSDIITVASDAATAAVQRSTLTFTGFADAMRQGGGSAASYGMTINEFAAAVGTMGLRLTSGTEIGTGFRMMLTRLQDPSKDSIKQMKEYGISLYDAQGATRPFIDVLADLEYRFGAGAIASGRLTEAARDQALAQLFGGRAIKTITALLDGGTKSYLEMLAATERIKATDLANAVLRPTASQAKMLGHNVQALGIAFSQGLDPFLNSAASSLLKFTQSIGLQGPRDLGRIVGTTLYNAFRNFGDLIRDVIVPVTVPFFRVLLPVAAAHAARAVVMSSAAMIAGLINYSNIIKVATLLSNVFFLRTIAGWVAVAAASVSSIGLMVIATANWGVVTTAQILLQIGHLAVLASAWIVARATSLASMLAYSAGIVAMAGLAIAHFVMIHNQAIISALTTAAAWLSTGLPGMVTFATGVGIAAAFVIARFGAVRIAAIRAAIATAIAWVGTALPAVVGAISAMLAAIAPFMLGLAAIAGAAALLVTAWSQNWFDIQGIVGKAVAWMLEKLNGFLDALSSLPLIGEHIAGGRAAIGGFFGALPGYAATAGNAVSGFVKDTIAGFGAIKNIAIPDMKDYAGELEALNQQLREQEDAAKIALPKIPTLPSEDERTEPGSYPDDGAAAKDAKKAAEDYANAVERAQEAVRDFNKELRKEVQTTTNNIAALYTKAYDDVAKTVRNNQEAIVKATEDAARTILETDIARNQRDNDDSRRKGLEEDLDREAKARERLAEDTELIRDRELDDAQRAHEADLEFKEHNFEETLAIAERARNITREDEDITYEKSHEALKNKLEADQDIEKESLDKRQDERENALKVEHDNLERTLKGQIDAREDALDQILDAEKRALEASQDMRENALREQLEAAKKAWSAERSLTEINTEDASARAKAQAEYQAEVARGVRGTIAQTRLNEKLAKISEDTAGKKSDLSGRVAENQDETSFDKGQDAQLAQLRATFEAEDLAQETAHQARKLALRVETDAAELALERKLQGEMFALRQQHENDRDAMQAAHEKARNEKDEALEKEALKRSRARVEEDRLFQEQQDAELRLFKGKAAARELTDARKREDEEVKRRRTLAELEETFRQEQQDRRINLDRILDQEEFDRKINLTNLERDERIRIANETMEEEQRIIRARLAEDIIDLRANMDERIGVIRESYMDKLEDLVRAGGEKIKPLINTITDNMVQGLNNVRDAAIEATQHLAEALNAGDALSAASTKRGEAPAGGYDVDRYSHFIKNGDDHETAMRKSVFQGRGQYQYGGVVPGPYGAQVPIMAHGGERYEGIGGHSTALAAVRAAESMFARGIGTSGTVQNSTSYNVNAHYGKVQPEGSIQRDLSALMALTRK